MNKTIEKLLIFSLVIVLVFTVVDIAVTNHSTRQINKEIKEINQRNLELIDERETMNRQQEEVIQQIQELLFEHQSKREGR